MPRAGDGDGQAVFAEEATLNAPFHFRLPPSSPPLHHPMSYRHYFHHFLLLYPPPLRLHFCPAHPISLPLCSMSPCPPPPSPNPCSPTPTNPYSPISKLDFRWPLQEKAGFQALPKGPWHDRSWIGCSWASESRGRSRSLRDDECGSFPGAALPSGLGSQSRPPARPLIRITARLGARGSRLPELSSANTTFLIS